MKLANDSTAVLDIPDGLTLKVTSNDYNDSNRVTYAVAKWDATNNKVTWVARASADVFEYVSPDYCCIGLLQLVEKALDETAVQRILLDADYACASS